MSTSPTRRPRGTLWLLRLSLAVHAVCLVVQPILAGRYLDGDYDAIGAHSLNGSLLPASGMVVGVGPLDLRVVAAEPPARTPSVVGTRALDEAERTRISSEVLGPPGEGRGR